LTDQADRSADKPKSVSGVGSMGATGARAPPQIAAKELTDHVIRNMICFVMTISLLQLVVMLSSKLDYLCFTRSAIMENK